MVPAANSERRGNAFAFVCQLDVTQPNILVGLEHCIPLQAYDALLEIEGGLYPNKIMNCHICRMDVILWFSPFSSWVRF